MKPYTLNIRGRLVRFDRPAVMGIVNVTDNSFYAPSRVSDKQALVDRVGDMLRAGASIIDIGACSTRPGSAAPTAEQEAERLCKAIETVRESFGTEVVISADTYRASVARSAFEAGADIINDVGGGTLDAEMFDTVAELHAPYVLMHMRGTPATMQSMTDYADVTAEVIADLSYKLRMLSDAGVADVIVDPGFGFAKTLEQNYSLLANLNAFSVLGKPVLVGVSHKSMLKAVAADTLAATTAVNMVALQAGAAIVRVHEVEAASAAVKVFEMINNL
ncbi:MAG: dihydropteroate synthase [Bacteroidales bacterium]|nr:dihydropteroate synthase [Bacteroidales bacterium]